MMEQKDRSRGPRWLCINHSNPRCHTFRFLKRMGWGVENVFLTWISYSGFLFYIAKPNSTWQGWARPRLSAFYASQLMLTTTLLGRHHHYHVYFRDEEQRLKGTWSRQSAFRAWAHSHYVMLPSLLGHCEGCGNAIHTVNHWTHIHSPSLLHLLVHVFSQGSFTESQLNRFMLDLGALKTSKIVVCLPGAPSVKFCHYYFPGKDSGSESHVQVLWC